jgi:hypothetical protein
LEADVSVPDFSATTFETLAQNLPHQVHDRVHQENDKHSDIQHEESSAQAETTKQELDREPHVQRAVDVMCQAGSSERVLTSAQTVRDMMSQFDQCNQSNHMSCSHNDF